MMNADSFGHSTSEKTAFSNDAGLVFSSRRMRRPPPEASPETNATPAPQAAAPPPDRPRKRLSGPHADLNELLFPIHKHWPDHSWESNWSLYWLPADFDNRANTAPDSRFARLFEALIVALQDSSNKLHPFTFMDQQLTYPHLLEHFILHAIEYLPLGAMGFCPGRERVGMPKHDQITSMDFRAAYEKLQEKKEAFQMSDLFAGLPRPQHFILGDHELARKSLLGRGGFSFFLSQHSQNQFADIAKTILAQNTNDPLIDMVPFAAPLFDSRSFLRAGAEQRALYFSLFDLYVAESQSDKGILIAASHNLDDLLVDLVESSGYRDSRRWSAFGRSRAARA